MGNAWLLSSGVPRNSRDAFIFKETEMAEDAPAHVGEYSPADVAYKLLQTIASNENKSLRGAPGSLQRLTANGF